MQRCLRGLLGGAAVIARSFARIHETNLKKQGLLPSDIPGLLGDYDLIQEDDRISLVEPRQAGGKQARRVHHQARRRKRGQAGSSTTLSQSPRWLGSRPGPH